MLLTVSGYLLYDVGDRELRELASLAHTGLGVAVLVVIVWHVSAGRIIQSRYRAKLGLDKLEPCGRVASSVRADRTGGAAGPGHRPRAASAPGAAHLGGGRSSSESA